MGRVLTAEAASEWRAGPDDWLEAVPFWGQVGGPWWRRPVGLGWGHCPGPPPLSTARRLAPLYASARALWLLMVLAAFGLLAHFLPAALCAALLGQFQKLLQKA